MRKCYKLVIATLVLVCFTLTGTSYAQNCSSPSNPPVVCTIWSSSAVPGAVDGGDPTAGEYGVKFRSDSDGSIMGLRFYKSSANTGTHIVNLWDANGTLLASATVSGESASGWQQGNFPSAVPITAGTTYIASYFAPNGHYSFNGSYFGTAVDAPPLHALANGTSVNGVYNYGSSSAFPTSTYSASNYWVDVAFIVNTSTPPSVVSTSPKNGATSANLGSSITATFSEGMDSTTINGSTVLLFDPSNNPVPGSVTYNSGGPSATLKPTVQLQPLTTYSAVIKGTVKDTFGNVMGSDFIWSFTTGTVPSNSGPGGPILVISSAANPFSRYYGEILFNEGLNYFTVQDISKVTAATLASYDVVIVGDMALTPAQVTMLTTWVNSGGNLIAMHPDKQLAGLLGLTSTAGTLSDAYLRVNTSSGPGVGIVNQTIQYHGSADLYTLNGASALATIYSNSTTSTAFPAVTLVSAGSGQAAAFAYDLARSVVYTRQGNPAWSGQQRDGYVDPAINTTVIRPDDLFFGNATFDPQPDWVDLNKVAIPQADEQQRLFANLIGQMNSGNKPLPRFWYFPSGFKAVVIMTGDDHARGGTQGRFDAYIADSAPGCSVADWQCVRSTSYVYPNTVISYTDYYTSLGFEIALHVDTIPSCSDWTPSGLDSNYTSELSAFASNFPLVPPSQTNRTHCVLWSDYDSQPQIELSHGIRLDTTYYYWPDSWMRDVPGLFTGSGMPMRFADRNGNTIDVYQATTQIPDEDNWTYPNVIDSLLNNALGAQGYYGAFTANMHTDWVTSTGSDAIVASAQAHSVPIVSSLQMLTWLDGRNNSSFQSLAWNGNVLSFSISVGAGARNLQAMVPTNSSSGTLSSISRSGTPVGFTTQTIKGVQYAFFAAAAGSYQATYGGSTGGSFTISGTITGAGGNSATVALSGAATATVTANSSGAYSFANLANGTYTVTPTNSGFTFTPANQTVTVNGGNMTANFTSAAQTFSISGNISGAGGNAASVALTGAANATTAADNAGNYTFNGVVNGTYTVTPSNTGFVFSPTSQGITVNGGNITGLNFSSSVSSVGLSSVVMNPTAVTGGTSSTGTVTLSGAAPSGGIVVTLADNNTAAQTPASVTVAAGATTATFTVTTTAVTSTTAVTVSASYNGTTVQAGLTINPATLTSLSLSPTTVVGGNSSTGTVSLSGPAPAGGALITLSDNSTSAQAPSSVTVAAGATTATFTVTTSGVASSTAVTVSATYNGTTLQAGLTINPSTLIALTLNPSTVIGGSSSTGTVTLNGAAPPGGALVTLSDNSASAQVPASVTIAAGATSATFGVTTSAVTSSTPVTVSATYSGTTLQAGLTINPPTLSSLALSPTSVVGGNPSTGTVTLSGPAPAGGVVVSLSDNSTAAQVPASVTVAAGSRTATFTVTTIGVASSTSATITATFGVSRSATLTINVASLSTLVLSPSTVTGGSSSTGTVTLNGAAPPLGAVISLSSSNTSVAQVPSSATIPAGANTISFTVTTSPVHGTSARISASYRGTTRRATLTVQ